MLNLKVEIIVKNVYGKETVYPANETAKKFAAIAGTTTMTHQLLCQVEALGIEIEDVTPRKAFGSSRAA